MEGSLYEKFFHQRLGGLCGASSNSSHERLNRSSSDGDPPPSARTTKKILPSHGSPFPVRDNGIPLADRSHQREQVSPISERRGSVSAGIPGIALRTSIHLESTTWPQPWG